MNWPERKSGWLSAVLLACISNLAWGSAARDDFIGQAISLNDGKRLYTEHHQARGSCKGGIWRPLSDRVTYRTAEGKPLAEKQADYRTSPYRPSYSLKERVVGQSFQVVNHRDRELTEVFRQRHGKNHHYRIPIHPDLVVDAGFDYYITDHWRELMSGQVLKFDFLAPTRGETIAFRVQSASDTQKAKLKAPYVFVMEPVNLVVRWMVGSVVLGYNKNRQIVDYVGLTNIPKNPDRNYEAHIHYRHQDVPCN